MNKNIKASKQQTHFNTPSIRLHGRRRSKGWRQRRGRLNAPPPPTPPPTCRTGWIASQPSSPKSSTAPGRYPIGERKKKSSGRPSITSGGRPSITSGGTTHHFRNQDVCFSMALLRAQRSYVQDAKRLSLSSPPVTHGVPVPFPHTTAELQQSHSPGISIHRRPKTFAITGQRTGFTRVQ